MAQQIPRRWRRGISLDPRYQEPKGQATLWTRARKVLWSWWPWFVIAVASAYDDRWGWAFSAGAMAFVSYLVTPIETPPTNAAASDQNPIVRNVARCRSTFIRRAQKSASTDKITNAIGR